MKQAPIQDTLYLACTRPAMRRGVPVEGFAINLAVTFVFGMVMGSPLYWGLFIVVHLAMKALTDRNPFFFRELRLWFETTGANLGGALYVLPARRPRCPGELPSAV